MKKIIIILTMGFASLQSFSQSDTAKVEQYCEVVATPKLFSNKVTIDINYGEEKSFWRDNRLKTDEGKFKKFNSVIDALNYMGKDGWLFVNAFPVTIGTSQVFYYGFKKSFLKSETGE